VDEGPEGDGELAANTVRNGGSNQGTNHSTDRELEHVLGGYIVCETGYMRTRPTMRPLRTLLKAYSPVAASYSAKRRLKSPMVVKPEI
jgi:hypothetical protein